MISSLKRIVFAVLFCAFATPVAAQEAPGPEAFGSMPFFRNVSISPSGDRFFAMLRRPSDEEYALVVFERDGSQLSALTSLRQSAERRIQQPFWASDDRIVFSLKFNARRFGTDTVETRLMSIDANTGDITPLFREPRDGADIIQIQDRIVSRLSDDPEHVLVQYWTPGGVKVHRVNVTTSRARHPIAQGGRRSIDHWWADRSGRVRGGTGVTDNQRGRVLGFFDPDERWLNRSDRVAEGAPTFRVLGFLTNEEKAYVASNFETETDALYLYDIQSDTFEERLHHNPGSDVYDVIQRPADGVAIGVTVQDDSSGIHWFAENEVQGIFGYLRENFPESTVSISSLNKGLTHAVAYIDQGNIPGRYYLVNVETGRLVALPPQYPALETTNFGTTIVTTYAARDSLEIPAYVTLPPGVETLQDATNLPFVINPHGGPNARTYAGFDWEVQFLAAQGYGVLQMNFRGSTGYGQEFLTAGDREWGQAMQDDITDGTHWLIERGIADPERIAILGASYGGYAALMGVIREPDLYQCAVTHGAVTNLTRLLADARDYVNGRYRTRHIGNLWSDGRMLRENSPASNADDITVPVLMFHGKEDRVVDYVQTTMMYRAMGGRRSDLATYIEFEDGSHFLNVGHNRVTYLREVQTYLADCLGG